MIVRWGLDALGALLAELGSDRPLLVTSARFAAMDLPVAERFSGVRRHAPVDVGHRRDGRRCECGRSRRA